MANKRAMLAFAAGMGSGYMNAEDKKKRDERQLRLDTQNDELHKARMEELRAGRQQRISLADAVAPAQVEQGFQVTDSAGSDAFTNDPDAAAVMQDMAASTGAQPSLSQATRVNQQVYTDQAKARKAESEYNSTDATTQRQIRALQTTDPAKAITLANAALENKQRLQKEADDAAFRRINGFKTPEEMAQFMSDFTDDGMDGKFKAKVLRSADGKSWSFVGTGPDGKEIQLPGQYSNDEDGLMKARMALAGRFADPERRLKFYQWEKEQGEKNRHNKAMETAAQTRAERAGSGGSASSDGLTREERLRYTSLFSEAGRRLSEVNKTMTTLQRSTLFMAKAKQPGSEEARQLAELQESARGYEQERQMYQGLLAGSQAPGSKPPGPGQPDSQRGNDTPKRISSAAERDALPKGARYIAPDGKTYIKQ
jgi:hypothetical protein